MAGWGGGGGDDEWLKLTIQDALEEEKSQYPHALLRSVPQAMPSLRPPPGASSARSRQRLGEGSTFASVSRRALRSPLLMRPRHFAGAAGSFVCRLLSCMSLWAVLRSAELTLSASLLRALILTDAEGVKPRCVCACVCARGAESERILEYKKAKRGENPQMDRVYT